MDNDKNPNPSTPQPAQPEPTQASGVSSPLPESPLDGNTSATAQVSQSPVPLEEPQILAAQAARTSEDPAGPNNEAVSSSAASSFVSGFSSFFGAIFSWVIFPIIVVLVLHNFVFQAYHVLGTSMVPTLHETDYLIISKVGYTQALIERAIGKNKYYIPSRGQIVVFRYPNDPSKVFVKRVIGLPGDRVVIKDGTVTIFNKQHPDGFNPDTGYESKDTTTLIDTDEVVQEGKIFVMGDNRTPGGSYDSREWGELPSSYIIGNAVLRLLPLDQVRIL